MDRTWFSDAFQVQKAFHASQTLIYSEQVRHLTTQQIVAPHLVSVKNDAHVLVLADANLPDMRLFGAVKP